ncbi:hypothetical protein L202_06221 [Cryptococcus amylolentus CBS 6039]|uniref:Dienelactone hydrolase domain-containing protein n=3 Tax=Cryptococcus amylolentus TaxID=104669 RepID=A0A1E3HIX4_9TREE|nr:hypothetical protein L202_06221 [Cryptococcus amylolentus CBS 6039]ODN76293.1 hypothetical protein L202_06221 [Cryptococcus amylolentus CBS 6039]ODN96240.1 hypothetical protein I350_08242 [Cryptococcus amylolentus CBS 6273]
MSEQTSVSPCCVTGHIHAGTPIGSTSILHSLRTYTSTPSSPAPSSAGEGKQDTVIFISDIFGIDLVNTKLLADEWAGKGWKVLLPDFFEGDAVPDSLLQAIAPNVRYQAESTTTSKTADGAKAGATMGPWLAKHREAVSKPLIEKYVQAVRSDPSTGKIALVGFCWGARYAFLLSQSTSPARPDVIVANHPSFLTVDDVKPVKGVPVQVTKGDEDDIMSEEELDEVEKVLKENLGQNVLVKRFPGAVHGFTVRGDMEDGQEKGQKEDAFKTNTEFVQKYFA